MEVLLKGSTKLNASPRKFAIPPLEFEDDNPKEISLDHLASIDVFERVTAMVKVLTSTEAIDVTGGKKKQDVLVADHSGTCKVVLWENNIGILKQDECYKIQNFVVREYAAIKFLSMGKESSTIIPIADIGEVQHYPHVPDNIETITNASIVGVLRLDNYKSCLRCKARVWSHARLLLAVAPRQIAACFNDLMSVHSNYQQNYYVCLVRAHTPCTHMGKWSNNSLAWRRITLSRKKLS